jgi:putative oxidoreductase
MFKMITALYERLVKIVSLGRSPFLLLIRVYIGYQCIISGWAHLHHIDDVAQFFASLHIPAPKISVIMSASTEIVFGALLLVGFLSRLSALALTGNFIVALLSVLLSNNNFSYHDLGQAIWNDQGPLFRDTAFPFLATALVVLFFGPGLFSIDAIVCKVRKGKSANPE